MTKRRPRFRRVKTHHIELTERDWTILRYLAEYRLLDSNHLVSLLGDGSPQHIRRRLQLLYHNHYLDRPRTQIPDLLLSPGSRPMVYSLGNRGAELLSVPRKRTPKKEYFDHTLAISSVLVSFEVACREAGNVRLIPWRELLERVPEETRAKKNPATWRVRLPGKGTHGITPDAIFGLQYLDKPEGANRAHFCLEVDRGTMPVKRSSLKGTSVWKKILLYHATATQRLHTTQFGWKHFRVLVVTTSEERVRTMVEACRELRGMQGMFLFSVVGSTDEDGEPRWTDGNGERQRVP